MRLHREGLKINRGELNIIIERVRLGELQWFKYLGVTVNVSDGRRNWRENKLIFKMNKKGLTDCWKVNELDEDFDI